MKIGLLVFFRSILSPTVSTWVCRASNVRESRVVEIYYYLTSFFFFFFSLFFLLSACSSLSTIFLFWYKEKTYRVEGNYESSRPQSAIAHFSSFSPFLCQSGNNIFSLFFHANNSTERIKKQDGRKENATSGEGERKKNYTNLKQTEIISKRSVWTRPVAVSHRVDVETSYLLVCYPAKRSVKRLFSFLYNEFEPTENAIKRHTHTYTHTTQFKEPVLFSILSHSNSRVYQWHPNEIWRRTEKSRSFDPIETIAFCFLSKWKIINK